MYANVCAYTPLAQEHATMHAPEHTELIPFLCCTKARRCAWSSGSAHLEHTVPTNGCTLCKKSKAEARQSSVPEASAPSAPQVAVSYQNPKTQAKHLWNAVLKTDLRQYSYSFKSLFNSKRRSQRQPSDIYRGQKMWLSAGGSIKHAVQWIWFLSIIVHT